MEGNSNIDLAFWGVDTRDARTLPACMLAAGTNLRFDNLVTQTRKGVLKPMWAHWPKTPGAPARRPWQSIYGAGRFRDPNGIEGLFLAAEGGVYWLVPNNPPLPVPLPAGVEVRGPCTFVQAFDKMFLFRGRYLQPLRLSTFDAGFEDLVPRYDATEEYHAADEMAGTAADEIAYGPFVAVSSLTPMGGVVVVVTEDAHGYVTGADVTLRGATPTGYNGRFNITVVDEVTFTFRTPTALGPATGTIECSNMAQYWKAAAVTVGPGDTPDDEPEQWTRVWNILPNADLALYTNNCLLVPTAYEPSSVDDYATFSGGQYKKTDYIVKTDYLDDLHFDFVNEARINQGSDDEIVDLAKWSEDTVVVWKNHSWGVLTGITNDFTSLSLDMRSEEYGLSARGAWALCGKDLLFVADKRGVVSIEQSELGKFLGVDEPKSAVIQGVIDRVTWSAAGGIRMANWNSRLYVAVPMDGATANNRMLFHDFNAAVKGKSATGQSTYGWTEGDTGTAICPVDFVKLKVDGVERLMFWGTDGWLNLVEGSDYGDQVGDEASTTGLAWEAIETAAATRAYYNSIQGQIRPNELALVLQTWNPCYSVAAVFGGVNKRTTVAWDKTRSRVRYDRPWDAEDWDSTNVNDDHGQQDRQDYSVVPPAGGLRLWRESETGGLVLNRFQEGLVTWNLAGRRGRSFQIELVNTTGRVRLLGTRLSGVKSRDRHGVSQ